ncbi:hypothetical protein ACT3CD_06825 [Geofilum sp. OHC36d9]|uniref:hypothetical protein n=1 Tax=Geofilum sp. OHC36d9 TaxID=3458413 RepID=UPI0040345B65
MKKAFIILLFIILVLPNTKSQSNVEQIKDLLTGIINFEGSEITEDQPIHSFSRIASQQADTMLAITNQNIAQILTYSKSYQHGIITVGQHTIVRIDNWDKCRQSGAWKTCMPYGQGFVKKGELKAINDYINNIIGIPDSQRRTLFLFKD